MTTTNTKDSSGWEDKSRRAFDRFLDDIKATLPPDANAADFEQALLKFSPEVLRVTLEALVNSEDFSPPKD